MPVVLDNDAGERVLLYGADGATLRKVVVDSSGRLVVVGPGGSGALTVSATDLDIRNLAKAQDELYAVLRTDAGAAYDARTRSWTITETVPVSATDLDIRNLTKALDELYAVLRDDSGTAYDARRIQGIDGSTQRQVIVDGGGRLYIAAPASPIRQHGDASVATGSSYVTILSYTVTSGKTLYVHSLYAVDITDTSPVAISVRLELAGSPFFIGSAAAAAGLAVPFPSPVNAGAGVAVTITARHAAAGSRTIAGGFVGYEI